MRSATFPIWQAMPVALATAMLINPAAAFDPNTFEALVIVEPDEEAFIFIGKTIMRHLKPGWHEKLPFIENVAVITTTAERYDSVSNERAMADGSECYAEINGTYIVSDARRAFLWRRDRGLDTRQQRELFKSPRDDYTEPRARIDASLSNFLEGLTARGAECGAGLTWERLNPDALLGTVNIDGTELIETYIYTDCYTPEPISCRADAPISRSSFSSVPGNPHHR